MQTVLTPSVQSAQDHYFGRHADMDSAPERDPVTDDERICVEAREDARQHPELVVQLRHAKN